MGIRRRGISHPAISRTQGAALYSASRREELSWVFRCVRNFCAGSARRGLPVDELGDAQQQVPIRLGVDRITKPFIPTSRLHRHRPFMIAESRLATDAAAKIQGPPLAIAVLAHNWAASRSAAGSRRPPSAESRLP